MPGGMQNGENQDGHRLKASAKLGGACKCKNCRCRVGQWRDEEAGRAVGGRRARNVWGMVRRGRREGGGIFGMPRERNLERWRGSKSEGRTRSRRKSKAKESCEGARGAKDQGWCGWGGEDHGVRRWPGTNAGRAGESSKARPECAAGAALGWSEGHVHLLAACLVNSME